jgi:hypothetical protein
MENGQAKAVQANARVSTQDPSDAEVAKAAVQGHEWAWNMLVDRFAPCVWAIARSGQLADGDSAEIFRLTWMRTADRLSALPPNSIARWLQDTAEQERARVSALQGVGANT